MNSHSDYISTLTVNSYHRWIISKSVCALRMLYEPLFYSISSIVSSDLFFHFVCTQSLYATSQRLIKVPRYTTRISLYLSETAWFVFGVYKIADVEHKKVSKLKWCVCVSVCWPRSQIIIIICIALRAIFALRIFNSYGGYARNSICTRYAHYIVSSRSSNILLCSSKPFQTPHNSVVWLNNVPLICRQSDAHRERWQWLKKKIFDVRYCYCQCAWCVTIFESNVSLV